MKLTPQEKRLTVALVIVLLVAITGFSARGRLEAWRAARKQLEAVRADLARRRALTAAGDQWKQRFDDLSDLMPVFEPGRKLDTYWLSVMDRIAAAHELRIIRRQAGKEERIGDVYEMPIECREWEGSLGALVGFLYDLQSEGIMLDMRYLYMRPRQSGNPDTLRGRFELYCAYMRGDSASPTEEPSAGTVAPPAATNRPFNARRPTPAPER